MYTRGGRINVLHHSRRLDYFLYTNSCALCAFREIWGVYTDDKSRLLNCRCSGLKLWAVNFFNINIDLRVEGYRKFWRKIGNLLPKFVLYQVRYFSQVYRMQLFILIIFLALKSPIWMIFHIFIIHYLHNYEFWIGTGTSVYIYVYYLVRHDICRILCSIFRS